MAIQFLIHKSNHLLFAPVRETQRSCFSKYRPEEFRVERMGERGEMMSVISFAYMSRIFCNDYLLNHAPQATGKAASVLGGQ